MMMTMIMIMPEKMGQAYNVATPAEKTGSRNCKSSLTQLGYTFPDFAEL